jgi:hypothetical protein
MLIQRFGEEVAKTCKNGLRIDQEMYKPQQVERGDKHEALILMRSIENNDPGWYDKLDSWLHKVRESYRIGFQNVYERWLQIRKNMLREGPCLKGTIETLFYEPCGSRWKTSKLKCTAPYHPKVLFEEVASWLQNDTHSFSSWEIYDEEGKVDIDFQRDPRDGERYIILSPDVSEELKGSMEARFKKFLQATRWRRIKSRYKIEIFQEVSEETSEPLGFETVAEEIHRKHVRYRSRWKQKKKILAQPVESSPLCGDLTLLDESTVQDQIQTSIIEEWRRVDNHVEPHLERRSRDCRSSLDGSKRGKSGDFEKQSSHPRSTEDSDRLKRQEDMGSESNAANAQVCPYDHGSPAAELAFPLREDSKLDDRFQAPHVGTESRRTGIPDSSKVAHGYCREDSKVMGEKPPELNQEVPQADLERKDDLTNDHDKGVLRGKVFNQGRPAGFR